MLPDVDSESWNGYQADQFSSGVDRKIGSLEFSTAADQRIGSLVPDAGATAPSIPLQAPSAPLGPAPSEPPASASAGGMTPDAPVLNLDQPPTYAPDAPLSTPSAASTTSAAALPRSSAAAAPSELVVQALQAADEAGVDPGLYAQVIQQESSWNPRAQSPAGAQGLSQLMPDTARGLGVTDPYDVGQNLKAGARYLRQQIDRFGGDVVKGLAAYNAGAGNVEKYGGVPPFAETQRYVDNIMSAVAQNQGGVGNGSPTGGPSLVPEAGQPARPSKDISQFGDPQLTTDEAYAACGPAAAVRFAQRFGRNPTLKEATDLAKTVGWTVQSGMAGLASEQALIAKLPDAVPTKLIKGPQWSQFAAEAQTGNPVIISTAGHYFTADGYDPTSGKFHVGQSGLDLKGGAEWMSPADMQRLMGAVQGGLLADNPQVPAPSTADQGSPNWWDRTKDAIGSTVGNAVSAVGGMFSNEPSTLAGSAGPVSATGEPSQMMPPRSSAQAAQDVTNVTQETGRVLTTPGAALEDTTAAIRPTLSAYADQRDADTARANALMAQSNAALRGTAQPVTPADQEWLRQYFIDQTLAVAGVGDLNAPAGSLEALAGKLQSILDRAASHPEVSPGFVAKTQAELETVRAQMAKEGAPTFDKYGVQEGFQPPTPRAEPVPAAPVDPSNQFQLHTEPGPGREPLTPEQAAGHIEDLQSQYETNDEQINLLEHRLSTRTGGRGEQTGGVARPPWAAGYTDEQLRELARRVGQNATDPTWWQKANLIPGTGEMREDVGQSGLRGTGRRQQTPTEMRRELARLRSENEQILAAVGHADENATSQFYRSEMTATPEPLPFDAGGYNAGSAAEAPSAQPTATNPQGGTGGARAAPQGAPPPVAAGARGAPAEPQLASAAEQQPASVALQGLINEAKARGYDTAGLEAQLPPALTAAPASEPPITADMVTGNAPPVVATPSTGILPKGLSSAKPRYSIGAAQYQPQFASDVDKALFIVAQPNPSSADHLFMDWLRGQFPGVSDAEIRAMGAQVRNTIKTTVSGREPGMVSIPATRVRPSAAAPLSAAPRPPSPPGVWTPEEEARYQAIFGSETGLVAGRPEPKNVGPGGTIQPGWQNIPGKPGGAIPPLAAPPGGKLPSKIIAARAMGTEPPLPPPVDTPPPVARSGITPETIDLAHQRIDQAAIDGRILADKIDAYHVQLDQMLAHGAAPDEIARFLYGKVEGKRVTPTSLLRTIRTGSMAGGLTTEGKVLLGPVIQTAMRAPVGVIQALLERNPGNIRAGLQGGISGLAEASADALQTLRYGINYRSALAGSAGGGYGFAPGLDVMGSNVAQRAVGTAAMGLVRTHGAIADVSAGIGRGAASATGATAEQAAEAGQRWALRSGKYGTIGKAVADQLEGLRKVNPVLDVVGQVLVPFYRVGYNALTQGVELSPVGALGTAADIGRARLPNTAPEWLRGPYAAGADNSAVTAAGTRLTKNMFGVGLAAVGLAQASAGNITGDHPPTGDPKWSIRVPETANLGPLESLARRDRNGNLWLPIRTLGPAGEAFAQSAILYESIRDGSGNIPEAAARSAAAYVGHVSDESFLTSIANIISLSDDAKNLYSNSAYVAKQAQSDLAYQATSIGKSFIPQQKLGEQIASALGTYTGPSSSSGSASTAVPTRAVAPVRTPAPTPSRRYVPPARATATPRSRP